MSISGWQSFDPNSLYHGVSVPKSFPKIPQDWSSEWATLQSFSHQKKLFVSVHKKKATEFPKRILLIQHGYGEHSGRYIHFVEYLKDAVDVIWTFDSLGHGKSEGRRGDALDVHHMIEDLQRMVQEASSRFPAAELHILGHSLGGLLTLAFLAVRPQVSLCSAQVSAPFFETFDPVPLWKLQAVRTLAKVWGGVSLGAPVDTEVLSRDPDVMDCYEFDRLNHSKMTPRFYLSLREIQAEVLKTKFDSTIPAPTQILIPEEDRLVSSRVTRQWASEALSGAHQVVLLPDTRHEGMNDYTKDSFFRKVAAWILTKSSIPSGDPSIVN